MLALGVSSQRCIPGSGKRKPGGDRPAVCDACGNPGGRDGRWLEDHAVSKNRVVHLCQLCHGCLHLDVAGRLGYGKVIWLPEISQERLNNMLVVVFMITRQARILERDPDTKGLVTTAFRLYKNWDKRASSVELMLGGSAVASILPAQTLSDPSHLAGLIQGVTKAHKLTPTQVAERLSGLRLLAAPQPFEAYIEFVAERSKKTSPPKSWQGTMQAALQARQGGTADDVTFDAAAATAE
jgi:hypothetical protein